MPRPSDRLISRYRTVIGGFGDRTSTRLVHAWNGLGSYGEADIATYTRRVQPALAGAKTAAVATSVAFFAAAHRIRPPSVNAADVDVTPRLADPFHAMWHAISEGRSTDDALTVGASVADAVARNFVTSVARQASDGAALAAGVETRWERVPDASACEWCALVAGQTYTSAETADFGHDRCSCTVVPTGDAADTGAASDGGGAVSNTTARGEGRRALGITSHHPLPGRPGSA